MNEQRRSTENSLELSSSEEGLCQKKQEFTKRTKNKTNCCIRCIFFTIFLILAVLMFVPSLLMNLMIDFHLSQVNKENKAPTRYSSPMTERLSEINPSTEMRNAFIKFDVIRDNRLKNTKFMKDLNLMQNKTIVTNVASITHTMGQINTQNSSNVGSKNIEKNDVIFGSLAALSPKNFVHDAEVTKGLVPERLSLNVHIDGNVNTDKNDKSSQEILCFAQFFKSYLKKLQNMNKTTTNDLEKLKSRNNTVENVNHLTLKSEEYHALNVSNYSNLPINLTQNKAQHDRSDDNSSDNEINFEEKVKARAKVMKKEMESISRHEQELRQLETLIEDPFPSYKELDKLERTGKVNEFIMMKSIKPLEHIPRVVILKK